MFMTLNVADLRKAHAIGFRRATSEHNTVDRSYQKVSWQEDIARNAEAVGAEMAVAQFFGVDDWEPTVDTYKGEADIGSRIEVKWSKWESGHLIITERDRKDDIAVLVVGSSPTYRIAGWIPVAIAKRGKYKRNDGSWWVGQPDLQPIETLMGSNYGKATL